MKPLCDFRSRPGGYANSPASYSRDSLKMRGSLRNVSVIPAKAGIQTWPRVPGLWIPAFAGMTRPYRVAGRLGDFDWRKKGGSAVKITGVRTLVVNAEMRNW